MVAAAPIGKEAQSPPGSAHGSTAPSVPCGTAVPSAEPRQPQVLTSPLSHFTRNINKAAPHPHQTPVQVPPPVPFTHHSHFASSVTSPAQPQASNHFPKGICFPKPPFAVPPAQLCSCVLVSPGPVSPISSVRNTIPPTRISDPSGLLTPVRTADLAGSLPAHTSVCLAFLIRPACLPSCPPGVPEDRQSVTGLPGPQRARAHTHTHARVHTQLTADTTW